MVETLELPDKQNNGETSKNAQLSKRVRVAPVPSASHSALLCTAAALCCTRSASSDRTQANKVEGKQTRARRPSFHPVFWGNSLWAAGSINIQRLEFIKRISPLSRLCFLPRVTVPGNLSRLRLINAAGHAVCVSERPTVGFAHMTEGRSLHVGELWSTMCGKVIATAFALPPRDRISRQNVDTFQRFRALSLLGG